MKAKQSEPNTPGTLKDGEYHPAASSALKYIKSLGFHKQMIWMESFASNAIECNRLAEICGETLNRVLKNEPVSDRYLLGLAWTLKNMEENNA